VDLKKSTQVLGSVHVRRIAALSAVLSVGNGAFVGECRRILAVVARISSS
jgi:hypothetical protein